MPRNPNRNPVINRLIEEFYDLIDIRKSNTKDIKDLKFDYGELIPLFVYDGLMRGHDDDHVLQECPYFGHATTQEDEWILMHKTETRVGMFSQTNNVLKYEYNLPVNSYRRIQGDLFGVSLDILTYLDVKLENGGLYHRCEIPIMLHQYNRSITPVRSAQVYVSNYTRWASPKGANFKKLQAAPIILSPHLNERVYHAYDNVKTVMPTKEITPVEHQTDRYNHALWEDLQDEMMCH